MRYPCQITKYDEFGPIWNTKNARVFNVCNKFHHTDIDFCGHWEKQNKYITHKSLIFFKLHTFDNVKYCEMRVHRTQNTH